jgi:pilus assembly protein CpaB
VILTGRSPKAPIAWMPSSKQGPPAAVRALVRQTLRHRRLLAAGLLAGAVACTLGVVAPKPAPKVPVLVATRALDAGVRVTTPDVRLARRPAGTNPGALSSSAAAIGRVLAAPVGPGEALTAQRLVGPGLASSLAAQGHVAAPVRLADADVAGLLRPGDVVDVLLAGPASPTGAAATGAASTVTASTVTASVVAAGARVVTVVAAPTDAVLGTSASSGGALLVLDVPREQALSLARAAALGPLSVLLDG